MCDTGRLSAFSSDNHRVRIAVSSPAFPDIMKLAAHRSFDGQDDNRRYRRGRRHAIPITRLSRAASTTAAVTACSRLMPRMRSICESSRRSRRKLPPVMRMMAAIASWSDMSEAGGVRPIAGPCSRSSRRISSAQGAERVDEADAGIKLGIAGQAFFDARHSDQHQANFIAIK
jgi:hypothetical protein